VQGKEERQPAEETEQRSTARRDTVNYSKLKKEKEVLRTTLTADNLFLQSLVDEIREQETEDVSVVEAEISKTGGGGQSAVRNH
jgi:hypothetical protein